MSARSHRKRQRRKHSRPNDKLQVLRGETAAGTLRNLRRMREELDFLRRCAFHSRRLFPTCWEAAEDCARKETP